MRKRRKDNARRKKRTASIPYMFQSAKRKILTARELPIFECLINPSWRENGFATILLARRQHDGMILCGGYMVDILCLGLKNTFCDADISDSVYETQLRPGINPTEELVECSTALAHHIIYGAIEYAGQFGFKPHEDFEMSQHALEERDSIEACEDIEFGRDGKPLYISGPFDDAECIARQLKSSVGEGNYDFIVRIEEPEFWEGV